MSNRIRVYIAGPIAIGDKIDNLSSALKAFRDLVILGFAPLCPQLSMFTEPFMTFEHGTWLDIDLPWVRRADAVLRLPGESKGADMEIECASANNVPVFNSIQELVDHFKINQS